MAVAEVRQPVKVIQWATGRAGLPALKAIIERPDTDLAGLWVSSEAKDGKDAGELCGLPPIGVRATWDAAALLDGPGRDAGDLQLRPRDAQGPRLR